MLLFFPESSRLALRKKVKGNFDKNPSLKPGLNVDYPKENNIKATKLNIKLRSIS